MRSAELLVQSACVADVDRRSIHIADDEPDAVPGSTQTGPMHGSPRAAVTV